MSANARPERAINNPYWMLRGEIARKIGDADPDLLRAADEALGDVYPSWASEPALAALHDWAVQTIETSDFGVPVRVQHVQEMRWEPHRGETFQPHSDMTISPGVMCTLIVRTSPGVRFNLGGMAEKGGPWPHDDSAVDLDMKPGELWAWNNWEVHSGGNYGPGERCYLLLRAVEASTYSGGSLLMCPNLWASWTPGELKRRYEQLT